MKKLYVLIATVMIGINGFADPTLNWGSDTAFGAGTGIIYTNGLAVAQGSDWLLELVNVADDSVLYSTTSAFAAGDGLLFVLLDLADYPSWNGLTVKSLLYDASTKETAELYTQINDGDDGQFGLSWSTAPPPLSVDYNAGFTTSALGAGPGQWQAIPEPAVASLIGLFGIGTLAARRIFGRS